MRIRHSLVSATALATLAIIPAPLMAQMDAPIAKARLASSSPVRMKMNVLFIYDSSGSMWGHQDGKPKVDLAREVLNQVISGLPPDANMGLVAYGHRQKNACGDIELLAPIGAKSADEIKSIVAGLKPKGITPLSEALATAADAFKGIEGAKMIVLITDGAEECSGDPCEVTRKLALSGLVVRVNVVGFSLSEKESKQLQCIAKEGTGRYFDVKSKETLASTIKEISQEIKVYVPPPAAPVVPQPSFPTTMPPLDSVLSEVKPVEEKPLGINLLDPANGGFLAKADNPRWESAIKSEENASAWVNVGQEAIFGFKDKRPATFSQFELAVRGSAPQNMQQFSLYGSSDSVDGPYYLIGHFSADNSKGPTRFQQFRFSDTTARYVKIKVLGNYGYPMQGGWGNTEVQQIRLMGKQP